MERAARVGEVRDIGIVAVPMTAGGDVLFPGGSQLVTIDGEAAVSILTEAAGCDPPEFGYLPVDAWGEPSVVGTVAVIDDVELFGRAGKATLLCSGISRFRVVHLDEDFRHGRVELFHDSEPDDLQREDIERLEERLVKGMTEIVRLSIKISDARDETRKRALAETLKRVEAFCGNCDPKESRQLLQHWILDLSPDLRRELLSFIVIDLLSCSFMHRRSLMLSTDTGNRLAEALRALEPFIKELAAKGAIVSALGSESLDGSDPDQDH